MKSIFLIQLLFLFIITACEKEPVANSNPIPPIQPPPSNPPATAKNVVPFVSTQNDIFIVLPNDSSILPGAAYDENQNIDKYRWKQVSGPTTATIVNPDSLQTKVRNLKKGNYNFELVVTDKEGLTGKDTAHVTVLEIGTGTNEILLDNINITCPWDCSVMIENFSSLNPDNMLFKISIKKSHDTNWIEIKHINKGGTGEKYIYDIYKNNLWIYAENGQIVDVKISY